MPRSPISSHERPPVTRVLQREWERLRTNPRAIEQANRWHIVDRPLSDLDELLRAVGSHTDDPAAEARLVAIVNLARHDRLAARVALQRLLAGLLTIALRRCRRLDTEQRSLTETIDELVAAAWIEICSFSETRRPACLAAALLSDTESCVFQNHRRRRPPVELRFPDLVPDPASDPANDLVPAPIVELAAIVRESQLDPSERELLRHLLVDGVDGAARTYGVTPRMMRYRRQRLAQRLRAAS